MKKEGFILLDVIIGLFYLGIIAVVLIPILTSSYNNFNRIKERDEMNFIGEMVVEKLKSNSDDMIAVIDELANQGEVDYLDNDFDVEKYNCKIIRTYCSPGLLEFIVKVGLNHGPQYIDYKASVTTK